MDVDFTQMRQVIDRPEGRVAGHDAALFGDEKASPRLQMPRAVVGHIGFGGSQGDKVVHADVRKAPGGGDLDGDAATKIVTPPGANQNS